MSGLVLRKAIESIKRIQAREKYEGSLIEFAEYVWPVVEPAIPMVRGWAMEAICDHLQAVTDGYIRRLLINVPPGFSKAILHETPVLTTWGWKRHGDLAVGDFVFGPDGQPKRVLACSAEMVKEAYEITFDDGSVIGAGDDHLWTVERDVLSVAPRYKRGRKKTTVKTTELRQTGIQKGKVRVRPDRIAVCNPVVFPPSNFLIDPYLLGAWLGDGDSAGGNIFAGQQDFDNFIKLGVIGTIYEPNGSRKQRFYRIRVDGLHAKLAVLGLKRNKHIPQDYLHASIPQRWALLQGLMDTDGTCGENGCCSFSNKNARLAADVHLLACSLGLKASLRSHDAKLNGRDYGKHYLVTFIPPIGAQIFRLDRKQGRARGNKNGRSRNRYVKSVKHIGLRHMKCIQVEENLYLIGNTLITTHNSLLTDVFWPAWIWGPRNRPSTRFMCAAYSNHLTERDNMRCRNIVISDRYKALWGNRFKISNEQFTKIKFANDRTGWKLATSVGGIGTGERADIVIIDDPNNPMEMESETVRDTTNMWFTEIMPDRLNNQSESAIVVIQQRTHEDDVSGVALSREMGYVHLCIPMTYEASHHVNGYTFNEDGNEEIKTFIGDDIDEVSKEDIFWVDKRINEDDLAWPERFPEKIVKELQRDKGPYAFSGQYQQNPEPRGGSIIKRDFWQLWEQDKYPSFEFILASLDTAYTAKSENDPSALTIWGVFRDENQNPKMMLMYAWQERLEFHDLFQKVIDTCTKSVIPKEFPRFPVDRLLIEAKASGQSVGQELHRLVRGTGNFGIELIDPKRYGDKVARVQSIQHLFADKMIYAPNKDWATMVINQMAIFPKGSHDDLCLIAGTLISTRRGPVPIEQVSDNDEVITPMGWQRVLSHGFTGWRPVIDVGPLTGTANHPVFTIDLGFVKMDSISQAQLVRFTLCDLIRTIRQKQLILMEKPIEGWAERENIISLKQQEMPTERRPNGFMLLFGSIFQEFPFQKATRFIIRTATPLIAALKILIVYRSACIAACIKRSIWSVILPIWSAFGLLQSSGILPQRALNGIGNMQKKVFKSPIERGYLRLREQESAFGVGGCLNTDYLPGFFALQNVRGSTVVTKEEDTNTFTPILRPVFNLTVEGARCYYANGVLVHNCDSTSQALRYLRDAGFALRRDEQAMETQEDMLYRSPSSNAALYPV